MLRNKTDALLLFYVYPNKFNAQGLMNIREILLITNYVYTSFSTSYIYVLMALCKDILNWGPFLQGPYVKSCLIDMRSIAMLIGGKYR